MAAAAECMLKRAIDQEEGIWIFDHIRLIDMLSTALRSLSTPRIDNAWRTELMVPRRAYSAEFTRCKRLPASTVSFSIRSPSLEKDARSDASEAITRLGIGENGRRRVDHPIGSSPL